jgi:hypothetical protein
MDFEFKSDKYSKECPEKHILDKISEIGELYHTFLYDDCTDIFVGQEPQIMTFDELLKQYRILAGEMNLMLNNYYHKDIDDMIKDGILK